MREQGVCGQRRERILPSRPKRVALYFPFCALSNNLPEKKPFTGTLASVAPGRRHNEALRVEHARSPVYSEQLAEETKVVQGKDSLLRPSTKPKLDRSHRGLECWLGGASLQPGKAGPWQDVERGGLGGHDGFWCSSESLRPQKMLWQRRQRVLAAVGEVHTTGEKRDTEDSLLEGHL